MKKKKHRNQRMDKRYKQVVQNTRIIVDKEIYEIIVVKEIEFIMTDKIIIG